MMKKRRLTRAASIETLQSAMTTELEAAASWLAGLGDDGLSLGVDGTDAEGRGSGLVKLEPDGVDGAIDASSRRVPSTRLHPTTAITTTSVAATRSAATRARAISSHDIVSPD